MSGTLEGREHRGWANPLRHEPTSPDLRLPIPRAVGGREPHRLTPFEQQRAEEARIRCAEARETKRRAKTRKAKREEMREAKTRKAKQEAKRGEKREGRRRAKAGALQKRVGSYRREPRP